MSMSYAIEAKKRKWDRLIESLHDSSSESTTLPRMPITTVDNASTVSLVVHDGSQSAKKKRLNTSTAATGLSTSSSNTSLKDNYLPSNRAAFLERLETFRLVTEWHIPSTDPIHAAAWAKRGWKLVNTDTVQCGVCKERVLVKLDVENSPALDQEKPHREENGTDVDIDDDSYTAAVELYDRLLQRFQEMIITAHQENCSWRKRGCDSSIQRIEGLLNAGSALQNLKSRYESISKTASDIPSVHMSDAGEAEGDRSRLFSDDEHPLNVPALNLAICGWHGKSLDIVECHYCFRSLGMWLYRGEDPTMEKLDAVDAHLEYCPWRSAEAQDTEYVVHVPGEEADEVRKEKLPGWRLVCKAIIADQRRRAKLNKDQTADGRPSSAGTEASFVSDLQTVTLEQREKKMKSLLKRIATVSKPFHVKSLLRKKSPHHAAAKTAS